MSEAETNMADKNLLHQTISNNSVCASVTNEKVYSLLKNNSGILLNEKDDQGNTPLHKACELEMDDDEYGQDQDGVVRMLLSSPGILVNEKNYNGMTPLLVACAPINRHDGISRKNTVSRLLATPGLLVNEQDAKGKTALHYACRDRLERVVPLLLKVPGININLRDDEDQTPLHYTFSNFCPTGIHVCELLLKTGDVLINEKDKNGWTLLHLLHHASCYRFVPFVLELLVNVKDNEGNTPLMLTAKYSDIGTRDSKSDTASILLKTPGILVNETNDQGMTALHYACEANNAVLVSELLKSPDILVNVKDSQGNTPMETATIGHCKDARLVMYKDTRVELCRKRDCIKKFARKQVNKVIDKMSK